MNRAFDLLFTPIEIGRLEIKNRIVMPPMVTGFAAPTGEVTQRLIDYYVARAQGGVGLVIVEAACVRADGMWHGRGLAIDRDDLIPGLRRLATAVQEAGAKVAIQLAHAGSRVRPAIDASAPIAPSSPDGGSTGGIPRELGIKEIADLVAAFGEAGRRAKEAGFEAVELHGAHGSILQQFLSPLTNRRSDSYGGSLSGRLRFPIEVTRAVKETAGAGLPLIYRLDGEEVVEGGLSSEDIREAARLLVEAGADAIHVTINSPEASTFTIAPPEVRQGGIAHLAEGIKEVVSVPVIAAHRFADPRLTERILREEKADLVAIGRGLIADPELPAKTERGDFAGIRRCIGCNEGCMAGLERPEGITCLYNPEVGREKEYALVHADRRKRVVVVGGGPAGLEAARVAAMRGHEVMLYEQESYLGGQLALVARVPGRDEFGSLVRYYSSQLREAGVKVELGFRANAAFVEDLSPDVLIIATGMKPSMPWTVMRWSPEAVSAYDVVAGREEVGQRVLILGGGLIGFDTALLLAERQKDVRVVEVLGEEADRPMPERTHAAAVFGRLRERGVEILSCTQVRNARDGIVTLSHEDRDEMLRRYPFTGVLLEKGFREFVERKYAGIGDYDSLVLALGVTPEQTIAGELRRRISEVYVIGDAAKPRTALEAIHQGAEVGRRI